MLPRSLPDRANATSELLFELLVEFFRLTVNAIGIVFYLSVWFRSAELTPGRRACGKGGRPETAVMKLRNTRHGTRGAAELQRIIQDNREDAGRYSMASALRMRLHGSLAGLKI